MGKIMSSVLDMGIVMCSHNTQIPKRHLETWSGVWEKGLDWICRFGCYESSGG